MGKEIFNIVNDMSEVLSASQLQKLQEVLVNRLAENQSTDNQNQSSNEEYLEMFLTAKHLEGCSDKTLRFYKGNIRKTIINDVGFVLNSIENTLKLAKKAGLEIFDEKSENEECCSIHITLKKRGKK